MFSLPAEDFETLEFVDEASEISSDSGLLNWVRDALLATVVTILHMLRHSSQAFTHLFIPYHAFDEASRTLALSDGFGTMALVDRDRQLNPAMILELRPADVVDVAVMREFARDGRKQGWWHVPGKCCVGPAGQANLLQAQVSRGFSDSADRADLRRLCAESGFLLRCHQSEAMGFWKVCALSGAEFDRIELIPGEES